MRYHVLAADYDGTLAHDGRVEQRTLAALRRVRDSGRKVVLVTGRHLPDLRRVADGLDVFDRVVAENGAVLWKPGADERPLAEPPPEKFLEALRERRVPFEAGHAVVATWTPHEAAVLAAIGELGLELQITFNKGAVMVLPPSVHKRSGLEAALAELGLTLHDTVAVGDAENDHAMLTGAECGVAVANALPAVKDTADVVVQGARGAGVEELIEALLADDLAQVDPPRRRVHLGKRRPGGRPASGTTGDPTLQQTGDATGDGTGDAAAALEDVALTPASLRLLVAGPSGSGKTTVASGVLERLVGEGYQVCLVDPEGDFEGFAGLTALGSGDRAPSVEEVLALLRSNRDASPGVSLLALPMADRPRFLAELMPRLQELRASSGRPHWIAIDEAHHALPRAWAPATSTVANDPGRLLLVTVHPEAVSPVVLREVNAMLAVGEGPEKTLSSFLAAAGRPGLSRPPDALAEGQVLLWQASGEVSAIDPARPRSAHRRHRRKYATGDVREKAFRFRGREGKLDLRAQNLVLFLQMGDGVDDDTWTFHLESGDYARWFREAIKDEALALEAEHVAARDPDPASGRRMLREAVERRYVLAE